MHDSFWKNTGPTSVMHMLMQSWAIRNDQGILGYFDVAHVERRTETIYACATSSEIGIFRHVWWQVSAACMRHADVVTAAHALQLLHI